MTMFKCLILLKDMLPRFSFFTRWLTFNRFLPTLLYPLNTENHNILRGYRNLKSLREKCPNTEFFLVRIFPHSDRIRKGTEYLFVFSPNVGI